MTYSVGFVAWLFGASCVAGFFGALLGSGGGVFIVPVMVLAFHLPMKIAVAASIVSVIATSNAGGSSYVDQRITNLRLAMFLEIATTIGALSGSVLALYLKEWVMLFVFAAMLAYMAYAAFVTRNVDDRRIASGAFARARPDRISAYLNLRGDYYDEAAGREVEYVVNCAPLGDGHRIPGGGCFGTAGRRRRGAQGVRNEPVHERPDESIRGDEQADDWRDRCRRLDSLLYGRADSFRGRGALGGGDYAGRDLGHDDHEPAAQRRPEVAICRADAVPGVFDGGQSAGRPVPSALADCDLEMARNLEVESKPATGSTEQNVYADVYRVLLAGMVVSTALFAAGIVRALMHPAYYPLSTRWVRNQYHWIVFWHGLVTGDAVALMMAGTVLLILTPAVRVIVSIWAFFVGRDYRFVVVTSVVLLVMILTVVAARLGLT